MIEYTPKQLGYILDKILKAQKKEIEGPTDAELKVNWLKNTTLALINALDQKTKEFNSKNSSINVTTADQVSVLSAALNLLVKNNNLTPNKG
jgi:hypothetical protein